MRIHLISVPYDSGRPDERMGAGPTHLLRCGAAERLTASGHEVVVEQALIAAETRPAEIATAFEVQRAVRAAVARAVDAGALPVVLSGNCNMAALGTLAGLATRNLGIIWFDAHGDFNTPETTIGGFLDGMALAMATGRCWRELLTRLPGFEPIPEANVILFGVRDLDPLEGALLAESHVAVVSSTDVSTSSAVLEELRHRVDGLYVHIDLDVLDPTAHGRANEFAVPGGLTLDQLALLLGKMANRFRIRGVGLTSYDPAFDGDGRVSRAALTLLEAVATEAERSTRSGALQGSGQRTTTLLEDE